MEQEKMTTTPEMKPEMEAITELEIYDKLRRLVLVCNTQKDAARQLGISPQYLSDVLRSWREISNELAGKLGYAKVSFFVKEYTRSGEHEAKGANE